MHFLSFLERERERVLIGQESKKARRRHQSPCVVFSFTSSHSLLYCALGSQSLVNSLSAALTTSMDGGGDTSITDGSEISDRLLDLSLDDDDDDDDDERQVSGNLEKDPRKIARKYVPPILGSSFGSLDCRFFLTCSCIFVFVKKFYCVVWVSPSV